jgi:hypothetical protein
MPHVTPNIEDVKAALKRLKAVRNNGLALKVIYTHGFAKSLASVDTINYQSIIDRADFLSEYAPSNAND